MSTVRTREYIIFRIARTSALQARLCTEDACKQRSAHTAKDNDWRLNQSVSRVTMTVHGSRATSAWTRSRRRLIRSYRLIIQWQDPGRVLIDLGLTRPSGTFHWLYACTSLMGQNRYLRLCTIKKNSGSQLFLCRHVMSYLIDTI